MTFGAAAEPWLAYVEHENAAGQLTVPKSSKVRAVPIATNVATALLRLGDWRRSVAEDDLVVCGVDGAYLDSSALHRRWPCSAGARTG
jgi:hypothetical protein